MTSGKSRKRSIQPLDTKLNFNLSQGVFDNDNIDTMIHNRLSKEIDKIFEDVERVQNVDLQQTQEKLSNIKTKEIYRHTKKINYMKEIHQIKNYIPIEEIIVPTEGKKFYWFDYDEKIHTSKWMFTKIYRINSINKIVNQSFQIQIQNMKYPIMYSVTTSTNNRMENKWNDNNQDIEFKQLGVIGFNDVKKINIKNPSPFVDYTVIKYKVLLSIWEKEKLIEDENFDLVNTDINIWIKCRVTNVKK